MVSGGGSCRGVSPGACEASGWVWFESPVWFELPAWSGAAAVSDGAGESVEDERRSVERGEPSWFARGRGK